MLTGKKVDALLAENGCYPDQVCRKGSGYIARTGYFYRHGLVAKDFCHSVELALKKAGVEYSIIDFGDVWKNFSGGAKVAQQSHWWVEFTLQVN